MESEVKVKCIKCGKEYPEKEFLERYNKLCSIGIVPMMVPMCKECIHRSNYGG